MGFVWVEYEVDNPAKAELKDLQAEIEAMQDEVADLVSPVTLHVDVAWQSPSADRSRFVSELNGMRESLSGLCDTVADVVGDAWVAEPPTFTRGALKWQW